MDIWVRASNLVREYQHSLACLTCLRSPGRHVAEASLWCSMVCILALFRIEKTEGSDNVKWVTGFASCVTLHVEGGAYANAAFQASTSVPVYVHPER